MERLGHVSAIPRRTVEIARNLELWGEEHRGVDSRFELDDHEPNPASLEDVYQILQCDFAGSSLGSALSSKSGDMVVGIVEFLHEAHGHPEAAAWVRRREAWKRPDCDCASCRRAKGA